MREHYEEKVISTPKNNLKTKFNQLLSLPDGPYPTTRYSGSKRRLLPNLYLVFKELEFRSAIDLFGGTGSVSYLLKKMNKQVLFNDSLKAPFWSAVGLIENSEVVLSEEDCSFLIYSASNNETISPGFIEKNFAGIYFTDEENKWLDRMMIAIDHLCVKYDKRTARFKRGLALHALFQSALRKRPFNMFHRANLQIRLADVPRSFGNRTTWETPFESHFKQFVNEVNTLVFDNKHQNLAFCEDARTWSPPFDPELVYIDPPYISDIPQWSSVDYLPKYHFLEGLARWSEWPLIVDYSSSRRIIRDGYKPWVPQEQEKKEAILDSIKSLVERYRNSTIALSYKEPGIPSIHELVDVVRTYKPHVGIFRWHHSYALAKASQNSRGSPCEVLILGTS